MKPSVLLSAVTRVCTGLVQRINRTLILDDQQIRAVRGGNLELGVGKFYLVDVRKNLITRTHIDLNELGLELGVLRASDVFEK